MLWIERYTIFGGAFKRKGYDFYEVKYTAKPIGDSIISEELSQLEKAGAKYNRLVFFSKSGFTISEPSKYIMYRLSDLYAPQQKN